MPLTVLQKKICNALQSGLPISPRPFAEIADRLDCTEAELLEITGDLRKRGVIRRIRALVSYQTLGLTSTLVTAHVPQEKVKFVGDAVNRLSTVSHNYLRNHNFNMWFTLQGRSQSEIDLTLSDLGSRLDVEFHSLPVLRVFKLDVRFDAESDGGAMLGDIEPPPKTEPVELSSAQKKILACLQDELQITAEPYAALCPDIHNQNEVLEVIRSLVDAGVVRRIAGVVNHRMLGFAANVMFAACVKPEQIEAAGTALARFKIVSHCYERRTFEQWPYNLFGMMHAESMGQIQRGVARFTEAEGIERFEMLATEAELKKQPVRHRHF